MWSDTSFVKEALCNIMKNVFCFHSNAINTLICCFSVTKSCLTLHNPVNCKHVSLPWSSLSPEICSNSCPLSQWCYITVSSTVAPFFFCLQSSPASGSFAVSQLFASGLTLLIPLQYKELSRVLSSIPKMGPNLTKSEKENWKKIEIDCLINILSLFKWIFCQSFTFDFVKFNFLKL